VSGRIDDPVDASFEGWPDEPKDLGRTFGELALSFSGLIFPPAKVLNIPKDRFLPSSRAARVVYLLAGLRIKLDRLESETRSKFGKVESQSSNLREAMKLLQSQLDAPRFEEAVAVACEESARASNLEKVEQFVQILVGSLSPNPWRGPGEDVATMIRDIAQLGNDDLRALEMLRKVHATAIAHTPNLHSSDAFSRETPTLKRAVSGAKIHPDDFLSLCERLRGFGLAAEPTRNPNQMGPDDYCYRPTRRGLALLAYLETTAADQKTEQDQR
jgi:hypothetical protein